MTAATEEGNKTGTDAGAAPADKTDDANGQGPANPQAAPGSEGAVDGQTGVSEGTEQQGTQGAEGTEGTASGQGSEEEPTSAEPQKQTALG